MATSFSHLKTVLIAHDTTTPFSDLTECLSQEGYLVHTSSSAGEEIIRLIQSLKPQVLIVIISRELSEKLDFIRQVLALRTVAVVVFMNEWNSALAKPAMDSGVSGYIMRPLRIGQLGAVLESSWHHFQRVIDLEENLELRKLLDRAKGILMKEHFITEEEAHQRVLKMSQDQSIPLKTICLSIIQLKTSLGEEQLKNT